MRELFYLNKKQIDINAHNSRQLTVKLFENVPTYTNLI